MTLWISGFKIVKPLTRLAGMMARLADNELERRAVQEREKEELREKRAKAVKDLAAGFANRLRRLSKPA